MQEKINEEVLCVLVFKSSSNQIDVDYIPFTNPLQGEINQLKAICENEATTLEGIILHLEKTPSLDLLAGNYKYCQILSAAFQGFVANKIQATVEEIRNRKELMLINQSLEPEKYNLKAKIEEFKGELKRKYELWGKAYAINLAYRECQNNKKVLTFSHRLAGWSNPIYNLTSDFSVELKTNFGFGRASYFYTKLKYKDIEITPFSEWIDYEFANFAEIVRYSQKYILDNIRWLDAMTYSKIACNLAMINEKEFINKYVIEECERMVKGLEDLLVKQTFNFKHEINNSTYKKDKTGRLLIQYRGEKISGSLDFISKILEFKNIISIYNFINRIEFCNKEMQPILAKELLLVKAELKEQENEMEILKPIFLELSARNNMYVIKINDLKEKMILSKELDENSIDLQLLNISFNKKFPEFKEFEKEFNRVSENHNICSQKINLLRTELEKILSYNNSILKYFENK